MTANSPNDRPVIPRLRIALWLVELGLVAFWGVVVTGLIGFGVAQLGPVGLWAIAALILFILLALAGHEINGQWAGVLIDTRNKLSLSRLQITLWTVMVLSAYLTLALPRVAAMAGRNATLSQQQALDISFPEQLIVAMGISAVSFAGANLIKSSKQTRQFKIDSRSTPEAALARREQAKRDIETAKADVNAKFARKSDQKNSADAAQADADAAPADAAKKIRAAQEAALLRKYTNDHDAAINDLAARTQALQAAEDELTALTAAQGLLHKNADPAEASWSDLFRGEEIGNYKLVDMSKVQMLFFTLIVITTYVAAVAGLLRDVETLRTAASISFPAFSDSLNALLGISHGTYLSVKSVDHS
jgi:hypothetical protein